jgi:hypothetical protein
MASDSCRTPPSPRPATGESDHPMGSSGPVAASGRHPYRDPPAPPPPHTSSSRLPRSSSMLAPPHESKVMLDRRPFSNCCCPFVVHELSICFLLRLFPPGFRTQLVASDRSAAAHYHRRGAAIFNDGHGTNLSMGGV